MMRVTSSQPPGSGSHNGGGLPPVASIPLTEDRLSGNVGEQSIGSLVKDATAHLSTLLRAEIELAKQEITGEVKKGLKGSVFFLVALTLLLLLMPFLLVTLALVISIWLPQWAGFAIITGAMLLGAAGLGLMGWRKVRKIRAPQQTIETVRDTAQALRRRGGSAGEITD
jgi:uncharacterized membrane protein YqjE